MCGRFTLFAPYYDIVERFSVDSAFPESDYIPSYNIAPSQQVVAVLNDGRQNRMGFLRWGLIPRWAKDAKIGYKMINARAETVAEKPSYRQAFLKRRCILPADSFYEWKKNGSSKTPMRIRLKDDGLFGIAGLWETWKSPEGETIHTCTAITTAPNSLMEPIHDRMPVILKREDEAAWLDPANNDLDFLGNILQPFDAEQMEAYVISSNVNSPKNNDHSLIVPVC